tara:strand:+ start:556 stop:882 length:327 start_codon:yes stop_codon:yes gene_type:complete
MKILLKLFLALPFTLINIGEVYSSNNSLNLDQNFIDSFDEYRIYKEDIKPKNQLSDIFGIDGFPEQRLRKGVFQLWETYEKESSKQIGNYRLNGQDINNTFNQSLKDL